MPHGIDPRTGKVEREKQFFVGPNLSAYTKPNPTLKHIDRLMAGEKPKIAITRSRGGIGDVLMTLPTVKAISKKYNIKITYGTEPGYLDGALQKVLIGNPYIEEVVHWKSVTLDDYDGIIDLTCPCVAHEKRGARPINRIDLFAKHAGVKLEDTSIDLVLTKKEIDTAQKYLTQNGLLFKKLILVQPMSSTFTRDFAPAELLRSLEYLYQKDMHNTRFLIITHGSDHSNYSWPGAGSPFHVLKNKDVRELAALMTQCELVICPDSAILHVASALKKKTVTLFGPTDPRARVNYHPEAVALWPAKRYPIYPIWYEVDQSGICWKLITPDMVKEVSWSLLNNESLPKQYEQDLITFGEYEYK